MPITHNYLLFSGSGPAQGSVAGGKRNVTASSDVPAAPKNIADGGKASLQPKRTPVSDKEIESIMVRYFHYENGKK